MKIPLSWIKEYTPLELTHEELVEKIATQLGEIEGSEDLGEKYKGIITAEIKKKENHPDADKLAIYKVEIGFEKEVQVVAGDKTLKAGDKVAYFPPGTKVPYNAYPEKFDGVVQKAKLRGVESEGMMASARELDLGDDHSVVMRLESDVEIGKELTEVYGLNDIVLDIENKAFANRADLFGILGIARELSGIQDRKFESPDWFSNPAESANEKSDNSLEVVVENKSGPNTPRFMAIPMKDIELKESPMWLKVVLAKVGVKSINNIVDITNYLMYLTGQPLHAYDYDKLKERDPSGKARIVVRMAKNGESITVLGGKTIELHEAVTVIADHNSPIGIAGMIGGQEVEIDENTKNIVIECANFNRYNIRRSSMSLGIFTEAVTRFTKAQSPIQCAQVIHEAIRMVEELANGKVAGSMVDDYELPVDQKSLNISVSKLNSHMGLDLTRVAVAKILDNIEYKIAEDPEDEDRLIVNIPNFRTDIEIPADLYEDVGRQYGYNKIPVTLPQRSIMPARKNKMLTIKSRVREILSSHGGHEALTYNFVSEESFKNSELNIDDAYHIKNPLSSDLEYMRTALMPSLLSKVDANLHNDYNNFMLYELNIAHNKKELNEEKLPLERQYLSAIYIDTNAKGSAYYSIKQYVDLLERKLSTLDVEYTLISDSATKKLPLWMNNIAAMFNPNRAAVVSVEREGQTECLGILGELVPLVLGAYSLPEHTSGLELDLTVLADIVDYRKVYVEPSRFPSVSRDLCFLVDEDVPYREIFKVIDNNVDLFGVTKEITPVDIYQGEQQEDQKQVTFRITMQHSDKTLTSKDIKKATNKVVKAVIKKFGAQLVE